MEVTYNTTTREVVIKFTANDPASAPLSKSEKSRILATTSGFINTAAGRLSLNLIK